MELAAQWIANCIEHHERCPSPGLPSLPTRVVFVGSDDTEPHLYITCGEHARYAALSHCWGSEDKSPPRTTHKTLNRRLSGMSFGELPKTFQDAVTITRRLGLQYLWIDSLCIIQDSQSDWEAEAANMATVYQNAYVTIAAEAASNSQEGCFFKGKDRRTIDLQLECPTPGDLKTVVYVRDAQVNRNLEDNLAHGLSDNPPSSRAWSWASVTGSVYYHRILRGMSISEHLHVLDVKCEQTGANPYGPARDGYIRLRGVVCGIRKGDGDGYVSTQRPAFESSAF